MKKSFLIILIVFVVVAAGALTFLYLEKEQPSMELPAQQQEVLARDLVPFSQWLAEQQQQVDLQKQEEITLLAVGDIMLSRNVGSKMLQYKDYNYPFLKFQEIISDADIAFGNLESPFKAGRPVPTGSFNFRADEEAVAGLKWAGFDVLNLANNHILNQGQDGLLNTFKLLEKNKIDYCGARENSIELDNIFAIKEVSGIKVGFLCFAYGPDNYAATDKLAGMALTQKTKLVENLEKLKKQADILVVSLHDGIEYEHTSREHQQEFAHLAIESGADLVIGHHPHVVQEVEQYQGKYIFYSLGNFVFDQMWSQDTRDGLVAKITLTAEEIKNIEYFPVVIEDYSQPRLANEEESARILNYLE